MSSSSHPPARAQRHACLQRLFQLRLKLALANNLRRPLLQVSKLLIHRFESSLCHHPRSAIPFKCLLSLVMFLDFRDVDVRQGTASAVPYSTQVKKALAAEGWSFKFILSP